MNRVYTDGAYSPQSGFGGWAWAVNLRDFNSGSDQNTTNNRMEMTAVLEAIHAMPSRKPLIVVSDSQYVVHAFNLGWLRKWKDNGWENSAGKQVKNRDLWLRLDVAAGRKVSVEFKWVKGHSGDPMNQFVDKLAVGARMRQAGYKWEENKGWRK